MITKKGTPWIIKQKTIKKTFTRRTWYRPRRKKGGGQKRKRGAEGFRSDGFFFIFVSLFSFAWPHSRFLFILEGKKQKLHWPAAFFERVKRRAGFSSSESLSHLIGLVSAEPKKSWGEEHPKDSTITLTVTRTFC